MPKITLVLDNLRSCHNVGSILRSADGFGVSDVICIGTTPYPRLKDEDRLPHIVDKLTKQIAKTALGAEKHLNIVYFKSTEEFLAKHNDIPLICLEQSSHSTPLTSFQLKQNACLVAGNEVNGVSPNLLSVSTHIEIPMRGQKESFNVAVATAICLYALTNN